MKMLRMMKAVRVKVKITNKFFGKQCLDIQEKARRTKQIAQGILRKENGLI